MSVTPMTCNFLPVLKAYLANFEHTLENKPNGQNKYSFPDGLILNIYETTGKVVFQGTAAGGQLALQIESMINQMNTPISDSP